MSWDGFQMQAAQSPMCSHCVETAHHWSSSRTPTCVGTCHPVCTPSTKQRMMLQRQWKSLNTRGVDSYTLSCPSGEPAHLADKLLQEGGARLRLIVPASACQSVPDVLAGS